MYSIANETPGKPGDILQVAFIRRWKVGVKVWLVFKLVFKANFALNNKTPVYIIPITLTSFHIMIYLDTTTFVRLKVITLVGKIYPKIWLKPLFKKAKKVQFRLLPNRHPTSCNIKGPRS